MCASASVCRQKHRSIEIHVNTTTFKQPDMANTETRTPRHAWRTARTHTHTPYLLRAHFDKYIKWINALGETVISAMNPLKDTHHIAPDGVVSSGSGTQMSGFTIIEAASIEAAVEITITCPFTEIGGSLEVSELVQMSD